MDYDNDHSSSWSSFLPFLTFTFIIFAIYLKFRVNRQLNNDANNPLRTGTMPGSTPNISKVKSISNPFYLEVDLKKSSLLDGIYFKVKTDASFKSNFNCLVVWSVNIQNFYTELEKNISEGLYKNDYLDGICIKKEKIDIVQVENSPIDNEYHYKTPELCKEAHEKQYNEVTKTYPVAIILYRQQADLENLSETDIVATYDIVHLKDRNMDSKILYTYKKLINNGIINMNRLYVQDSDVCVVCLTAKSDQVLLPCKHVCTCSSCFQHLDNKCPMCRGPVYRSFKVD